MIPLPKEKIDHIFEPKREIRTAQELEGAVGRLLTDDKGQVFCLNRASLIDEYRGRHTGFEYRVPNRTEPGYVIEWGQRKIKKGTWPVWITGTTEWPETSLMRLPVSVLPCWELLPAPTHQAEIIITLYRLALPDWDDIVKIESYPRISDKTWKYIMDKFMAFDKRMHPGVIPGGAWCLGSGFSNAYNDKDRDAVPDWMIDLSSCHVAYKWTPFWFEITESRYGDNDEYSSFRPYIRWNVPLPEPWAKQFMGESLDPSCEKPRPTTLAEAQAQCEERAGCPLKFAEVPPHNEHISAEWQSDWVQPQKEATRAA